MSTIESRSTAPRPQVIVDFSVDDGLLSVHLQNIGLRPAYVVKTLFDKPFSGLGGEKRISDMRLFRRVEFMPPAKRFSQYVDLLSAYARRKEPMRLVATVSYRDDAGNRYEERITHDLRIYLDLGQAKIVRIPTGGE